MFCVCVWYGFLEELLFCISLLLLLLLEEEEEVK